MLSEHETFGLTSNDRFYLCAEKVTIENKEFYLDDYSMTRIFVRSTEHVDNTVNYSWYFDQTNTLRNVAYPHMYLSFGKDNVVELSVDKSRRLLHVVYSQDPLQMIMTSRDGSFIGNLMEYYDRMTVVKPTDNWFFRDTIAMVFTKIVHIFSTTN